MAADQLPPAGEQHRGAAAGQHGAQLRQPGRFQRGQQAVGEGALQRPRHAGHRDLHAPTTRRRQQPLQLGIGQRHVRSHQHQPRQRARGRAPAQAGQGRRAQGLRRHVHQGVQQAGGRLEQQPLRPLPRRRLHGGAHRVPQHLQLLRTLRIHHQPGIARQPPQPLDQRLTAGGHQFSQADLLHRLGQQPPAAFLGQPVAQHACAVAEAAITGEGRAMHRLAMQQMTARHRGASALQEGGHQQGGVEGAQLRRDHLCLQRRVPPQGGVAAAHHQPALDAGRRQRRPQCPADLPHPIGRRLRLQSTGVGEQEQQRRRVAQGAQQGAWIPAEQQQAAMHRLRAGGIVVEDDHLQRGREVGGRGGHGTIVP